MDILRGDIQDKTSRIEKITNAIAEQAFDAKIQQSTIKMRSLEEERDALNIEFKNLSLQADERAKLDLKRDELKSKSQDMKTMSV